MKTKINNKQDSRFAPHDMPSWQPDLSIELFSDDEDIAPPLEHKVRTWKEKIEAEKQNRKGR